MKGSPALSGKSGIENVLAEVCKGLCSVAGEIALSIARRRIARVSVAKWLIIIDRVRSRLEALQKVEDE